MGLEIWRGPLMAGRFLSFRVPLRREILLFSSDMIAAGDRATRTSWTQATRRLVSLLGKLGVAPTMMGWMEVKGTCFPPQPQALQSSKPQ